MVHSQVLLHKAALNPFSPYSALTQVQAFLSGLAELLENFTVDAKNLSLVLTRAIKSGARLAKT